MKRLIAGLFAGLSSGKMLAATSAGVIFAAFLTFTLLAGDSFQRADGALTTPWSPVTGESAVFQVSSNTATVSNLASDSTYRNTSQTWPNDQYSSAVLGTPTNSAANHGYGVAVRADIGGSNDSYYASHCSQAGYEVVKKIAGTLTQIKTAAVPTCADGDTLSMAAQGTNLLVYKFSNNVWTLVDSETDTALTSGAPGISFSGTDLSGGSIKAWAGGRYTATIVAGGGGGGGGTGVKWHPGNYAMSNQNLSASNASSKIPVIEGEIDQAFANSNVTGFMALIYWSDIEPTSLGSYNFADIDTLRSYIATKWPGRRFAASITSENFGSTSPTASMPAYILSSSTYGGPGNDGSHFGYCQISSFGMTASLWNANVSARIQAMFAAVASHVWKNGGTPNPSGWTYDTDPSFEAITFQESATDLGNGGTSCGYTIGSFTTQWEAIGAAMVASFSHTNVPDQNNFFGYTSSSVTVGSQVTVDDTNAGMASSSPDVYVGVGNFTWGQYGFMGSSNCGSCGTSGFASLAGKAASIAIIEQPDYTRSGGGSGAVSGMFASATNQPTAGGFNSSHIFWTVLTAGSGVSGDWNTLVSPSITANPIPSANKTCPSVYVSKRSGCNTL